MIAAPSPASDVPPIARYEAVSGPLAPVDAARTDDVGIKDDRYRRMTVPVHLGGAGPYRFLVDTGADRTSLSRELASTLGLQERPSVSLLSATGRTSVAVAFVPELKLSGWAVRQIDAPLLAAEDIGADGILGIDSLRSQRVLFDFAAQRLTIHSSDDGSEVSKDAIIVRARRREGRLVITNASADERRLTVVLDTGAELSVGNGALRRALERQGALSVIGPIELVSVTGKAVQGELAVIRQLDIGGARLEGVPTVFADAYIFRALKLDRRPTLLLGMNALRMFDQVSIDFGAKTLRLVVPKVKRAARIQDRSRSRTEVSPPKQTPGP